MRFFYFILFFLFLSCAQTKPIGPNYNQGRSHNESVLNRSKIVNKEQIRSRKQMNKTRKRASRVITRHKPRIRHKNKYIH